VYQRRGAYLSANIGTAEKPCPAVAVAGSHQVFPLSLQLADFAPLLFALPDPHVCVVDAFYFAVTVQVPAVNTSGEDQPLPIPREGTTRAFFWEPVEHCPAVISGTIEDPDIPTDRSVPAL
jgi:hypothetical protein